MSAKHSQRPDCAEIATTSTTYSTIGSGMPQGTYVASGWNGLGALPDARKTENTRSCWLGKDPEHFYVLRQGIYIRNGPIPHPVSTGPTMLQPYIL